MATLTTQSIGAASGQLINPSTAALQRLNEAAQAVGVDQTQNLKRASDSAVAAQRDQDRSVQLKKRTEGSFSGQREESEGESPKEGENTEVRTPSTSSGRLNRTA